MVAIAATAWHCRGFAFFAKAGCVRSLRGILEDCDADSAWPPHDVQIASSCPCCASDATERTGHHTWVGCDVCDVWFHACCLGITDKSAESLGAFRCPRCVHMAGAIWSQTCSPPPIVRTRRCSLLASVQLLSSGAVLPARMPALSAAAQVLHQAEGWRTRLVPRLNAECDVLLELLSEAHSLESVPLEVSTLAAALNAQT